MADDARNSQTLPEGTRNDGLMRLAGAMRRRGAELAEIEKVLFEHNARRCRPPLSGAEVSRIAASIAKYPVGGLDILDAAWQAAIVEPCASNFERFVRLTHELQRARPGQTIALPLVRIAELMRLDWTTVRCYRQAAIRDGLLKPVAKHVPHRRAGTFRVALSSEDQKSPLGIPTSYVSSGLVGIETTAPSGNEHGAPSGNPPILKLAMRGWRLFPLKERAKEPAIKEWHKVASTDASQLENWSLEFPRCNWAVATGPESGVFVIDVDGAAGENAFCSLVEEHGTWEKTLGAITGRGRHFYLRYPERGTIRNSASKLGAGIDIRGQGGYAIVPPSIHPSGVRYSWVDEDAPIAQAPDWLAC